MNPDITKSFKDKSKKLQVQAQRISSKEISEALSGRIDKSVAYAKMAQILKAPESLCCDMNYPCQK